MTIYQLSFNSFLKFLELMLYMFLIVDKRLYNKCFEFCIPIFSMSSSVNSGWPRLLLLWRGVLSNIHCAIVSSFALVIVLLGAGF